MVLVNEHARNVCNVCRTQGGQARRYNQVKSLLENWCVCEGVCGDLKKSG